jgi:hypothetical protein
MDPANCEIMQRRGSSRDGGESNVKGDEGGLSQELREREESHRILL